MEITQTLARYVVELDYDRIPEDVRRIARRALIDTFGCAIAGSAEPAARIAARAGCEDGGSRRATVLGAPPGVRGRLRLPPANAAMINAIAGHALDYDDVNPMGHPSVPVAFTALAAAEDARSSGRELLAAYVAGVELETKVMRAFSDGHYLHGWHSTNTLGVLGAAAAAAKVYRLDAAQFVNALGIAASQAAGLRQNFGTMTKPFHPGHASWSGLTAVRLARLGFTADSAILEAPLGYLKVFSAGAYEPARAVAHLDKWALIEPGLSVKKYPCCYCTHPSLDAALSLRERDGIQPDEIASIRAELSPFFLSPLIHHRPATGLEGKFSLEYALAAAMLDSRVALATFTDAMVQRPEARQLVEKVTSAAREPSDGGLRATFVRLTVELTGGRRISHEVAEPRGTAANPLSDAEIEDKFRDCCRFAGVELDRANRALAALWKIDRLKGIAPLASLLAGGTSAASSAGETARAEEAAHRAASK
jgi:2-methylcitrate dehydratase PrpD